MRTIKWLRALLVSMVLVLTVPLSAHAAESIPPPDEAVTMPPAYTALPEAIPPELESLLPDGLFSEDAEAALAATAELTDWRYLLNTVAAAVGLGLEDMARLFCVLMGLILLAAVCGRLREGLGGSGEIFGFCLRLTVYTAIVLQTVGAVETVQTYFDRLLTLTGGMIPVMGTLYALGGNLGRAAVSHELMTVFLGICQYVSATVTPPLCALCVSFSLMDALGTRLTLSPLAEQIKRWFTSLLGLVMFLLSLALSTQSVLVGKADTLGMRGIKYAVGNAIPVVGGAVAGSLSAVSAGIGLLRGVCGVAGILLVALLLLPSLVELLLLRATLRLASTVASMLACDGEAKLLGDMASLHGYLAAAVSVCSVAFILALGLLAHSGTAL
jgi:stage III sporulation protein AE